MRGNSAASEKQETTQAGTDDLERRFLLALAIRRKRNQYPQGDSKHPSEILTKTPLSKTGGAKSGAFPTENDAIDADLQAVIDAWPDLPTAIRAAMLAMVNAAVNR